MDDVDILIILSLAITCSRLICACGRDAMTAFYIAATLECQVGDTIYDIPQSNNIHTHA